MLEAILRIVYSLVQPGSQLVLLFGLLCFFVIRGKLEWSRRCLAVFLVLLFLYGLPWFPEFLANKLENRYGVLTESDFESIENRFRNSAADSLYIMILGAGHSTDPRLGATSRLGESVMMRLAEGIRIYRLLDERGLPVRLVTSAGGFEGQLTQAEAVAQAAVALGVPDERISRLHEPSNTCGEAREFRETFGEGQLVLLSTSAMHQRRAVQLFAQTGSNPVAAPASFLNRKSPEAPNRWWRRYRPSQRNLELLKLSVKEYAGFVQGLRGCTIDETDPFMGQ